MPRAGTNLRNICLTAAVSLLIVAPCASGQATQERPAVSTAARQRTIVIGFVGGFVKHNDPAYGTVRLAQRLRAEYASRVVVRVFENHHEMQARRDVLRLLDTDHDGTLSAAEKRDARIIIFGHSWGGSETVNLARQLAAQSVPVLLTVQVDSVRKPGENDAVIPSNVEEAANFYQPDGIIHGRGNIRAANPGSTQILGNFRFDYKDHPLTCNQYPWHDRIFMKTHMEMDCDPRVWDEVESLIRSKLPDEAHGL
jgi:pimeloyl-ACP methyl ester carboxylesterase